MEQPEEGASYLWFVAAGLALYCVLLTAITGDIGFNGDDWWILSFPCWHTFWDSLVLYASKFLRPVEGLYWIGLFELFGFNKVAFHLCSLLLLAGSAVLMGVALDRALPGRRTFVSLAVLLAFFLPPVSCLTYILFTDNSRLSMLLFWMTVLAFQRWARQTSPWRGLLLPVTLYVSSFLTYEAPSFLIFLVPLLVWPVHRRCLDGASDRSFLIKLCAGIMTGFATAVALRFLFLKGGAVGQSYFVPPLDLLWSYLALLPFYLVAPFTSVSTDRWAWLAGILVVLGTGCLMWFTARGKSEEEITACGRWRSGNNWCLVVLGAGILVLGMLPYQLAGYGSLSPGVADALVVKCGLRPDGDLSWFNFSWASRIYSSASFGVAVLLAAAMTGWRNASARWLTRTVAVVIIGFMAVFHAGLSLDWKEAAVIRNDLMRSLVIQVPAASSHTNFVFMDIDCSHKRAEIFRKWECLRALVGMLYTDPTLCAWYVSSRSGDYLNYMAKATPEGFLSRGQRQGEPAPHDSLLLFKREGRELILLKRITAHDDLLSSGIAWQGVEQLASNVARIEAYRTPVLPGAGLAHNAWTSGLISTFQLNRLKTTLAYLPGSKHGVVTDSRRRRLIKMRLHRLKARL